MRTFFVAIALLTSVVGATPASAFERGAGEQKAQPTPYALEPQVLAVQRSGRTLAAFYIGDRAVTLAAYGRRARARAMGNADDVRHARAMAKVFDRAPQPALLTFEVSLKF